MVSPGAILNPADLSLGDLVQARDGRFWYDATIIAKTGRGASHAATVKFDGFGRSHNAKFTKKQRALRVRLPRAALKAEQREQTYHGDTTGLQANGRWEV